MPAFPGTVRVAGTLSATDGAVIVTEDRLSLQAGEDNLGNWSLDTLDVAHKGHAITISIDNEIVVFMTDRADQLVEAVQAGARRAAAAAAVRNDRIKHMKRPRIGRKASAKRKIELFDEQQRPPIEVTGVAAEPGADPWLRQITVDAPILTPVEPPAQEAVVPEPAPPPPDELPDAAATAAPVVVEPEVEKTPATEDRPPRAPRRGSRRPQLRPSMLIAIAGVAAMVALGVFFTAAVSLVTLGVAAVAIMVAIAGIMDQTIELRLPKQLSVIRLFGLGLALLAATTALTMLT